MPVLISPGRLLCCQSTSPLASGKDEPFWFQTVSIQIIILKLFFFYYKRIWSAVNTRWMLLYRRNNSWYLVSECVPVCARILRFHVHIESKICLLILYHVSTSIFIILRNRWLSEYLLRFLKRIWMGWNDLMERGHN